MKKIQFNQKSLESLKANELQGTSSIVGGAKYPSQWSSGSASGTDTVYWGSGETRDVMLNSETSPCLYVDIDFHNIAPGGGRTTVAFEKFVGYM